MRKTPALLRNHTAALMNASFREGGPLVNGLATNDLRRVPTLWAMETLRLLTEELRAVTLMSRDFPGAAQIAQVGDVINVQRPADMRAFRKVDGQAIRYNDVTNGNTQVRMDQWWQAAYAFNDGELGLGLDQAVTKYLRPAAVSIARQIDRCSAAQAIRFLYEQNQAVGQVGTALSKATLIDASTVLDDAKCPDVMRSGLITTSQNNSLLKVDDFTRVDRAGTSEALRRASLGSLFNVDYFKDLNTPYARTTNATLPAATTTTAAADAGATTVVVASATGLNVGDFITVAGDGTPLKITNISTLTLTVSPALRSAVSSGATVQGYGGAVINQSSTAKSAGGSGTVAGYRADYHDTIVVTGALPKIGQLVTLGATITPYVVIDVDTSANSFTVDRLLSAAIANGARVGYGPPCAIGAAFHNTAIGMVTRTLQPAQIGVLSSVANFEGLALRLTIAYNSNLQRHEINFDMLGGFQLMYPELGCAILS